MLMKLLILIVDFIENNKVYSIINFLIIVSLISFLFFWNQTYINLISKNFNIEIEKIEKQLEMLLLILSILFGFHIQSMSILSNSNVCNNLVNKKINNEDDSISFYELILTNNIASLLVNFISIFILTITYLFFTNNLNLLNNIIIFLYYFVLVTLISSFKSIIDLFIALLNSTNT